MRRHRVNLAPLRVISKAHRRRYVGAAIGFGEGGLPVYAGAIGRLLRGCIANKIDAAHPRLRLAPDYLRG